MTELTRMCRSITESFGYRELQQSYGRDVIQLKHMLHALGHFRRGDAVLQVDLSTLCFDAEVVQAVNAFREARSIPTRSLTLNRTKDRGILRHDHGVRALSPSRAGRLN